MFHLRNAVFATVLLFTLSNCKKETLELSPKNESVKHELVDCTPPNFIDDDTDISVYSAVLKSFYPNAKNLTVLQKTFITNSLENWKIGDGINIDTSYFEAIKEANGSSKSFSEKLKNVHPTVSIVSKYEYNQIFDNDNSIDFKWFVFYQKYRNSIGILSFSNIAYNATKTQATLEMTHGCGSLCGEGRVIVLQKVNNEWTVITSKTTWMS